MSWLNGLGICYFSLRGCMFIYRQYLSIMILACLGFRNNDLGELWQQLAVFFRVISLAVNNSLFGYNPEKFWVLSYHLIKHNVFSCTCWLAFTLKQIVTTAVHLLIAYKVPNKLVYDFTEKSGAIMENYSEYPSFGASSDNDVIKNASHILHGNLIQCTVNSSAEIRFD